MKYHFFLICLAFLFFNGISFGEIQESETIFSDDFDSAQLSSDWKVYEGHWTVENGALSNKGGGLIVLQKAPGANFVIEAEASFPPNWFSFILFFTGPKDYGVLYLGGGVWETFEFLDDTAGDYRKHSDSDITVGDYHKLRIECEYGLVSFYYDGVVKGKTQYQFRPGALIGFRNRDKGGLFRLKNITLKEMAEKPVKTIYKLQTNDVIKSHVYKDYDTGGQLSPSDSLKIDNAGNDITLDYNFSKARVFESVFARIPVDVGISGNIDMEITGCNSNNNFFVIVHDVSGEQHLVAKMPLAWNGKQQVRINLESFLTGPEKFNRFASHWGGDNNQKIDFPISAIDIGVAKRGKRTKNSGELEFGDIRFTE
jgi:hypothetical protein